MELKNNILLVKLKKYFVYCLYDNVKKAGVKQNRIHDFRYSFAPLLINNGANITMYAIGVNLDGNIL